MRKVLCTIFPAILFFASAGFAQQAPASPAKGEVSDDSGRLPVQRVVLYKTGVGYFEHTAQAHGTEDLNIDFSTAQLNDVLKSLTVVDLGKGRITGIRFNSVAPPNERLRALHLGLGQTASRRELLDALRGTRVEVKGPTGSGAGKILSVEYQKRPVGKGEAVADELVLSIITDSGELRTFDLDPGVTVRIADRKLDDEVGRYLSLIGSNRAADVRRMTISAAGTGDREIFVSYISEVPVWKSTYRILLSKREGANALVQGWAIVDNTLGEDWNNVRLSLVAGAPQSFVQNISVPYYVRRPVVPLPESVTLTPQTYEAANAPPPPPAPGEGGGVAGATGGGAFSVGGRAGMAALTGVVTDASGAVIPNATVTVRNEATGATQTANTDAAGRYIFANVQPGNSALSISAMGFQKYLLSNIYLGVGRMNEIQATLNVGQVAEQIMVTAARPEVNTEAASISNAMEEQQAEAEGKRAGEHFEYDIKEKVTIGKNQSALVPIVQTHLEAQKVTVWKSSGDEGDDGGSNVARRALWLTNTSGLTLDGGTFNVLEEEVFQGEGVFDPIRAGEKRLIAYAGDPAVRVTARDGGATSRLRRVQITKGVMIATREERRTTEYRISNFDTQPREVVLELAREEDWKLAGEEKPAETTPEAYRFILNVGPKESGKLAVEETKPDRTTMELGDLKADELQLFVETKEMSAQFKATLREIVAQKESLNGLEAQMQEQQRQERSISTDQARLRENMKALKGTSDEKALVQRYVGELNAQEDRLAALRSRYAELKNKHDQAQAQLDETIQKISLDETF